MPKEEEDAATTIAFFTFAIKVETQRNSLKANR